MTDKKREGCDLGSRRRKTLLGGLHASIAVVQAAVRNQDASAMVNFF